MLRNKHNFEIKIFHFIKLYFLNIEELIGSFHLFSNYKETSHVIRFIENGQNFCRSIDMFI